MFGGEGKTVQIDETFLTKRKYHLGGITEQMSIIVLSIYFNPMISRICTDNAKQYHSVEEIISSSCMQLNQSIVEFVAADDCTNTINNLEAQNKLLQRAIVFWKKAAMLVVLRIILLFKLPFKRHCQMPIDEEFDFENSSKDDVDNPLFDSS
uniref:Uncharacterized protein n=1 Tax=Vespula pensylvanica TaxID=30213 RepID=A0A834K128_VESPE|nr:hypothetical protein H0235_016326 [Vespula pensylvanica]